MARVEDWDYARTWYHGSPRGDLTELRKGSAIAQNRDTARAFSHKPSFVGAGDKGVQHNGKIEEGFLYRLVEEVRPEDIDCTDFAGNEDRIEWLIQRSLAVARIAETRIRPEELITEEEIEELRRRMGGEQGLRNPRP